MANGTINLLRWWKEKGDAFATAFAEEKKSHLAKGNSLQDAFPIYFDWRRVKDYFWKCWRYRQAGILTDADVRIVVTPRQAAFYLQVIEPIGIEGDPTFFREIGEMLLANFPDSRDSKYLTDLAPAPL